jgi:hypothetical protein
MDIYDGEEWTEMDIEDLKAAMEHGRSIEDAARKCAELGLKPKG